MFNSEEQKQERLVRLRWACRRTLKELDAPLLHFLNQYYANLPMGEQFAFERLLSASDHVILQWLKGQNLPRDQGILDILQLMRGDSANSE